MSAGRVSRALARPLVWLVRAYQLVLSPLSPPSCRFYPSCSAYAVSALEHHGPVRGTWLAARRLVRCHPWAAGGVDHVPGTPEAAAWETLRVELDEERRREGTTGTTDPVRRADPAHLSNGGPPSRPTT